MNKEDYCTDCNGEAAVKLEDCPRYKEKLRKEKDPEEEKE